MRHFISLTTNVGLRTSKFRAAITFYQQIRLKSRRLAFPLVAFSAGLLLVQPCVATPGQWEFTGSLKDRKSTRLNSSHLVISYAVFCLINNIDRLTEALRGADAVVHSAGSYRIGIRRSEHGAMWDANVGTTTRILDAAEAAGKPQVVYG